MPVSPNKSTFRLTLLAGLVAVLPLLVCTGMGMSRREMPPLHRAGTVARPLQFARYCINHGRDPISHTSVLTSRFRFRNIGDATITLGEIERSCGCLTPVLSHQELQPGEMGEMRVSVPLVEQSAGSHEFQLTVHYNSPQPRHETVLIKAVFPEPRVQVTPRAMEISQQGESDHPITHQFSITDHRSSPLQITDVESSTPWVTGTVAAQENKGAVTRIAMEVAGGIPPGTHRVLLQAHTDDARFPTVNMPIRIRGPERAVPVEVRPSMLRLHARETTTRTVLMQVPASWQVSHVDCLPVELSCEWESNESSAGATYQQISLKVGLSAPPASRTREGVLTLYANAASEMQTLRVEIIGTAEATSGDRSTLSSN